MSKKSSLPRGMDDLLPDLAVQYSQFEGISRNEFEAAGYQEIRTPLVELTELFSRSAGSNSDIVSKEMYTVLGGAKQDTKLSLRPEGTAPCLRAVIENNLLREHDTLRLWYCGPMFRHERPQKGRRRQFQQIGVELVARSAKGIFMDIELLSLGQRLWRKANIENKVRLEINSLGSWEEREKYCQGLKEYLFNYQNKLDADSQRRLHTNPLRILDSKEDSTRDVLSNAPLLEDYLGKESKERFSELQEVLHFLDIPFVHNPRLVRGLDYYSQTVFEWKINGEKNAQDTLGAGGCYDDLIGLLGGPKNTSAAGFALGVERALNLLEKRVEGLYPHVYVVVATADATCKVMQIVENFRKKINGLRLAVGVSGGKMKAKMKEADRSGADLAFILGDEEIRKGQIKIKYLRNKVITEKMSTFGEAEAELMSLVQAGEKHYG